VGKKEVSLEMQIYAMLQSRLIHANANHGKKKSQVKPELVSLTQKSNNKIATRKYHKVCKSQNQT
jgi:hypothetical protein